jgi:hypothetical protein
VLEKDHLFPSHLAVITYEHSIATIALIISPNGRHYTGQRDLETMEVIAGHIPGAGMFSSALAGFKVKELFDRDAGPSHAPRFTMGIEKILADRAVHDKCIAERIGGHGHRYFADLNPRDIDPGQPRFPDHIRVVHVAGEMRH